MTDGSDVSSGGEILSGGREDSPGEGRPARTDAAYDRRARYLAKAASLGQVVSDEESLDPDR